MALILSGDTGVPASGMPTGSVIQTVTNNYQTYTSSSSTSLVDVSGFSATITPTSATNKVLILLSINGISTVQNNNTTCVCQCYVTDGNNNVITKVFYQYIPGGAGGNVWLSTSTNYLHSPATTSAITYKVRMQGDGSGNGWQVNNYVTGGSVSSGITLMEIHG